MPKYYSPDMRAAALACISRGERREDIVKFFGISLKTLSNWVRMKRDNKDISPNNRNGYKKSNDFIIALLQMVEDNPDYTLDELSEHLSKHRTTIFYHLKKLGITRKKNHSLRRKK